MCSDLLAKAQTLRLSRESSIADEGVSGRREQVEPESSVTPTSAIPFSTNTRQENVQIPRRRNKERSVSADSASDVDHRSHDKSDYDNLSPDEFHGVTRLSISKGRTGHIHQPRTPSPPERPPTHPVVSPDVVQSTLPRRDDGEEVVIGPHQPVIGKMGSSDGDKSEVNSPVSRIYGSPEITTASKPRVNTIMTNTLISDEDRLRSKMKRKRVTNSTKKVKKGRLARKMKVEKQQEQHLEDDGKYHISNTSSIAGSMMYCTRRECVMSIAVSQVPYTVK